MTELKQKKTGLSCGLCCTKIQGISVTLGGNKILDKVDLHIHCGELTALIGPNGAGKSTLLRAILGEVKHEGTLSYFDSQNDPRHKPTIGYVPQILQFDRSSPLTVAELFASALSKFPVWLGISFPIKKQTVAALALVEADHLINRRLGSLSGGELQRVLLALAMEPLPEILLLDEPVSGVDQKGMDLFYCLVSKLRKDFDLTIVLVSHDLDLVSRYADRVILLDKTILTSGKPREVYQDPRFQEFFGTIWAETLNHHITEKNSGEAG